MSIILGAGLSGLIAATQFPNATIIEANGPAALSHRAVLRFRSDVLSRLTGIPFRKVTVRKSIWCEEHCAPDIQLANWYSKKTNGGILDRSVWNIEPVERFIAPEDLIGQMIGSINNRVKWHHTVDAEMLKDLPRPIISTIPMPVLYNLINPPTSEEETDLRKKRWVYSGVVVDRYRVKNADVFQTIYYADPNMTVYRASITGDLLIVERTGKQAQYNELEEVCHSFGITADDIDVIDESHHQRFGKITPINDQWRRQLIFDLSHTLGIYSLGRFAIWKNVLLDDVAHDTAVIKRLITQGSYGAVLQHARSTTQH